MITNLKKRGDIKAFSSSEIAFSRVGIGFEKLDRAVFDPEKAYDKVAALGVKWVRIQSGWQRTETEKGIYHFEWLELIVDNLLKRGLVPWVCLCYGNELYDETAAKRFGGVGCPPIKTKEQRSAWHNYVKEVVHHFKDKVTWWEIWNEPDCAFSWNYMNNAKEYGEFAKDTSSAIRAGSEKAKVIGGAFASSCVTFLKNAFETGMAKTCDAISFHIYSADESLDEVRIRNLKAMIKMYNPELKLIQGESGCQSRHDGCGALAGQAWTPEKQAKSLSRHIISQLGHDVMFSSYFSSMDMIEALNGKVGDKASYLDYGYFGVLAADFDENGFSTGNYTPKLSYRSLQVIASIFREEFSVEDIPVESIESLTPRYGSCYRGEILQDCYYQGFRKPNGSAGLVYWKKGNTLRETFEGCITIKISSVPRGNVCLVDMIDGVIYELNSEDILENPKWVEDPDDGLWKDIAFPEEDPDGSIVMCRNLPLFDRPLLLCFGDFL